jgi:CRP-like cAMP-binding protein
MSSRLLRKLTRHTLLSAQDETAIQQVMARYKVIPSHRDVVCEGDSPDYTTILLDGYMCRYTTMRDGKRQILSFLVPGDFCDLSGFVERRIDHFVGTLTPCTVAVIAHRDLGSLVKSHPSIRDALWRETLQDAAIYRAWISNIGRRSAYERLAHLFCEISLRLEAVGMMKKAGYEFMVTQVDLGDALGLSGVHVNRMLQQLRSEDLITFNANTLAIHNWDRLREISGFDSAYLGRNQHETIASVSDEATAWSPLQPGQSPPPESPSVRPVPLQGRGSRDS